jgi:hypothetical protein
MTGISFTHQSRILAPALPFCLEQTFFCRLFDEEVGTISQILCYIHPSWNTAVYFGGGIGLNYPRETPKYYSLGIEWSRQTNHYKRLELQRSYSQDFVFQFNFQEPFKALFSIAAENI